MCTLQNVHSIQCALYTRHAIYSAHYIHWALYKMCTLYNAHSKHCVIYTVCTLYKMCILYSVHSIKCALYTMRTLPSVHSIQCNLTTNTQSQLKRHFTKLIGVWFCVFIDLRWNKFYFATSLTILVLIPLATSCQILDVMLRSAPTILTSRLRLHTTVVFANSG